LPVSISCEADVDHVDMVKYPGGAIMKEMLISQFKAR
jgi:hypothetical protein